MTRKAWVFRLIRAPLTCAVLFFIFLAVLFLWRVFFCGEALSAADMLYSMFPWHMLAPQGFQVRNGWMLDTVDWMYPAQVLTRQAFDQGRLPLWNPYASSGTPLATLVNYGLFYPFTLFYLLLPVSIGVSLHAAARFVLASLGLYLLARDIGLSHVASLVGGIIYAFCGFNVVWIGSTAAFVSAAAPLTFFITHRLFRLTRLSTTWGLALSVAIMIAGGFVSVAAYYLYALGAYALFLTLQRYIDNSRNLRHALRPLLLWAIGVGAGFMLISMQLLPFLELTELTSYDEGRTARHTRIHEPTAPEIVRLVVPEYYGHPVDWDWWSTPEVCNPVEGCGYVGILPWFLALFGLWERRSRQRWFFLGLVVISFGMIYRLPWQVLFIHLPLINSSFTMRMFSTLTLGVAMLAAIGADTLLAPCPDLNRQQRQIALWSMLALAAAMVLLVILTDEHWWRSGSTEAAGDTLQNFLSTPNSQNLIFGRVLSALFWLGTGVAVMVLGLKRLLRGFPLAAAILFLIIADLFIFGMRFIPTLDPEQVLPTTPGIEWLQQRPKPSRFTAISNTFWPSTPSVYGLEDIRGHNPLRTDRYRRILHEIDPTVLGPGSRTIALFSLDNADFFSHWIDVLGVEYVAARPGTVLPTPPEGRSPYEVVYEGPDLVIYRNPEAAPRFYVARRILVEPEEEALIARLESVDFHPGEDALVEEEIPGVAASMDLSATVQVRAYEPERVSLEVETSARSLLVTAEQFYPGWQATVDGEEAPVYRVNYDFRAVVIPPGRHVVEFVFNPASFNAGLVLASVTAGGMGLSLLVITLRRQDRRPPIRAESPTCGTPLWAWWRAVVPFCVALAALAGVTLTAAPPSTPPPSSEKVALTLYGTTVASQRLPPSWPRRGHIMLTLAAPAGPAETFLRLTDGADTDHPLASARLEVESVEPDLYEVAYTLPPGVNQPYLLLTAPAASADRPVVVEATWDATGAGPGMVLNDRSLDCLYLQVRETAPRPQQWIGLALNALEQWWWEERARIGQDTWQTLVVLALVILILSLILPFRVSDPGWFSRTTGAAVLCLLTMLATAPAVHLLIYGGAYVAPDARLRATTHVAAPATAETRVVADLIAELGASTTLLNVPGSGFIESRWFNLPDGSRPVLWMHPPSEARYTLSVPAGACLHVAPALHPDVWDPEYGDGVAFIVRVSVGESVETIYDQTIDPKNNPLDRRWFDTCLPLDRYADQEITLSLSTYPLSSNDWDWAGWGNPAVIMP